MFVRLGALALAICLPAGWAAAADSTAQDAHSGAMAEVLRLSQPGPKHALLEPLIGTWDVEVSTWMSPGEPPLVSHATVTKSWVLGKRFLYEEFTGTGPDGKPYSGIGYWGHDNIRKRFSGLWMSTYGSGMIHYHGSVDAPGTMFTFEGREPNPMGRGPEVEFRMVLKIVGEHRHVLTQYYVMPIIGSYKAFEMIHTRKK